MNGGGNPSVGGGGFAASPAGTAPLYYKSAEIASGSAKNLCKKSGDVGGCALRGTGSTCRPCPRRGVCLLCRPPTVPFACFPAPYPPDPLPRWGRGRPKVYFAGGFAPGTPAFNRLRHLQSLPSRYPAGGLPGWSPAYPAFGLPSCPLSPPAPFPGGEGGDQGYFMQGASPLASPRLSRRRHLQNLPSRYPAAEIRVCRKTDRKRFPMSSAGSQGEGGPGERNFGV